MAKTQKLSARFKRVTDWLLRPFLKIENLQWRSAALATVLAGLAWVVVAVVVPLAPFGEHSLCTNDGFAQYMPFLSELWSTVREGGSLFYTFNGGLGQNFYLTMAYYLFSPLSWIVLLFDKAHIPAAANLIIILKNMLVIALMAWYLPSTCKTKSWSLAGACALAYGFGFYFLGYAVNFMWMDCIALVPLMLYGMERLNTRKGRAIYLISLAFGILTNFYMGAIVCIFLAFYYLFMRLRFTRNGWKDFFRFAACSLSAVLVSAIVLLPVIEGMLMANTSRMSPPDLEWFNDLSYILSRLLPDAEVVRITHNRGTINVYMGTAVLVGTILYVINAKVSKRAKFGLLLLCVLYFVSTQQSWLNYALHGFYLQRQVPNRYGFVIGLLATLMSYQGLLSIEKAKFKWIVLASGLSALSFGLIFIFSGSEETWLGFVLPALCIAYGLLAIFNKRSLIAVLIVIESYCGLVMVAPGEMSSSYTKMSQYLAMAKEAKVTEGFGRSEIFCSDIANAPMLYGLKGISAFNSVINPKTASLLGKLGFASGENYYRTFGLSPISALFLDVQSVITDMSAVMPYPYERTQTQNNMSVWKSPYDLPIGICLEYPELTIGSSSKFENLNKLYSNAYQSVSVKAAYTGQNEFVDQNDNTYRLYDMKANDVYILTLDPFEAQDVYLYANMGGTKNFTVRKNGTILVDNKYEGNMVSLGDVKPTDLITITFKVEDDKDEGKITIQAATCTRETIDQAAAYFTSRGLQNEQVKGNTIRGDYSSDKEETMIFTIPFDEGWKAYVNGKSVETTAWQNALVSIQLPAGENAIRLVYEPAGFKDGAMLSTLGLFCAVLAIGGFPFRKKKDGKNKDSKNKDGNSPDPESEDKTLDFLKQNGEDPDSFLHNEDFDDHFLREDLIDDFHSSRKEWNKDAGKTTDSQGNKEEESGLLETDLKKSED